MVAYSFNKRFEKSIADGTKIHTVWADRKRHAREGEELQLYTGMRTKFCKLITRQTCLGVYEIRIDLVTDKVLIARDAFSISAPLNQFAQNDGFKDWQDFKSFWNKAHPNTDYFIGKLIIWHAFNMSTFERW